MKNKRIYIYILAFATAMLMYYFREDPFSGHDNKYLRSFYVIEYEDSLNVVVDSVGYSQGSYYITSQYQGKIRIDAHDYINQSDNKFNNLINISDTIAKKVDSDTLFILINGQKSFLLLIDRY